MTMAIHLLYFRNASGDIQIPPNDECYFSFCPPGYDRFEANTLDEVDRLQKALQEQTYRRQHSEWEHDEALWADSRRRVIESLQRTLASSTTTQYEREFIHSYIQLREEKRDKYRSRFICDKAFLELRENDRPRTPEETLGESL
jgi:GH43 family beta-xylosidase